MSLLVVRADAMRDGSCNGCGAGGIVWKIYVGSMEVRVCNSCRRALIAGLTPTKARKR